jgi:hypothetical protein
VRSHKLPEWAQDEITVRVGLFFSWKDRLKILLGWRIELSAFTLCENKPGRVESTSEVRVWRHKPMPKGWGAVEAPRASGEKAGEGKAT